MDVQRPPSHLYHLRSDPQAHFSVYNNYTKLQIFIDFAHHSDDEKPEQGQGGARRKFQSSTSSEEEENKSSKNGRRTCEQEAEDGGVRSLLRTSIIASFISRAHILSTQWPGLPGRGEYVRLAFEYAGVPYTEQTNPSSLLSTITNPTKSSHPPAFAPPALKLPSGRFVSQTPAILNHVAPKFGLIVVEDGVDEEEKEERRSAVNQLVLTALDLCNEVRYASPTVSLRHPRSDPRSQSHDTHHPIATEKYYDEQKDAALLRAASYRKNRLPKFLHHFQNVLATNPDAPASDKTYLVGAKTTTADLTLFHVLCGVTYAFPRRVAALEKSGEYGNVFKLKERVGNEERIKEYLNSERRQAFGVNGVFRHYPELDGEE